MLRFIFSFSLGFISGAWAAQKYELPDVAQRTKEYLELLKRQLPAEKQDTKEKPD